MLDREDSAPTNVNASSTERVTIHGEDEEEESSRSDRDEFDSVFDISGKSLELSLHDDGAAVGALSAKSVERLYIYRNVFNLIPRSLGSYGGGSLKMLKFFANDINLFPPEFENSVELESLQVRISDLGFSGVPLHKLKALKELDLSKTLPRFSSFPVLGDIVELTRLTRLSVCHYSIRYLPPEIGSLTRLEYLDLSFNKMKSLPKEISTLNALLSLKVANNKLVEIPSSLSSLQRLQQLDLSKNRLTSLGLLDLSLMHNLQNLNLKHNKLLSSFPLPAWIHCEMDGNGEDACEEEFLSYAVEMEVTESFIEDDNSTSGHVCSSTTSMCHQSELSSNNRSSVTRRLAKRWKRRQHLQQRARRERLNSSRKWIHEDTNSLNARLLAEKSEHCRDVAFASEDNSQCNSEITCTDESCKIALHRDGFRNHEDILNTDAELNVSLKNRPDSESSTFARGTANGELNEGQEKSDVPAIFLESAATHEEENLYIDDSCSTSSSVKEEDSPSNDSSKSISKLKRHLDLVVGDVKPRKYRRSVDDELEVACKYNAYSFCSIEDRISDGFYDAGRDRPFLSLEKYEQSLDLDSREVLLLDRNKDEVLDAITLSAQASVARLVKLYGSRYQNDQVSDYNLLVASFLALFVSDHFGGNDKSSLVELARKAVVGSNYSKPFVCTCATGNSQNPGEFTTESTTDTSDDLLFHNICDKSILGIKTRRNSVIVPLGSLKFGVCRHRAVLLKYLCDRIDPPVPCELIRGYLDFSPHAWNAIHIQRAGTWVRMIVDSCHPHDIREETDPEYFCRYIPLTRLDSLPDVKSKPIPYCSFPSLSSGKEFKKAGSSSLLCCRVGSVEVAAKVRTLEVCEAPGDKVGEFEHACLGEVRILGAVKGHSCIVDIYGHRISSEWISSDGTPKCRVISSAILIEYVKGGSLKEHMEKLLEAGQKCVPVVLALIIAREVACGLKVLHSKHIIHRDIKSENILIDLEKKRDDGCPIIKICDFDRAVPLRSYLHSCCISHKGGYPPDICVGTPQWMAPEVYHAMHERRRYGLEVDIWSYGCLLLELLTLKVPYSGLPESEISQHLQDGIRPPLTNDLEAQYMSTSTFPTNPPSLSPEEHMKRRSSEKQPEVSSDDAETEALIFLVNLYYRCTEVDPFKRPTAEALYDMLLAKTRSLSVAPDS